MFGGLITGVTNLLMFLILPLAGAVGLYSGFQWIFGGLAPKQAEAAKVTFFRVVAGVVVGLGFATVILPEVRGWMGV